MCYEILFGLLEHRGSQVVGALCEQNLTCPLLWIVNEFKALDGAILFQDLEILKRRCRPTRSRIVVGNASVPPRHQCLHYFVENYVYEYEYEDEIMENGDVYKKPLNPDLKDAYELKFDFDKNDWTLTENIITQENPASNEAKARKNYIEKYSQKYSFGSEIDIVIENYISELDTFIENNPPLKLWKYINFNINSVPKLPTVIAIEIAKLPSEGV
jgi:hypothetical protein